MDSNEPKNRLILSFNKNHKKSKINLNPEQKEEIAKFI
jgi:hypothetical protein